MFEFILTSLWINIAGVKNLNLTISGTSCASGYENEQTQKLVVTQGQLFISCFYFYTVQYSFNNPHDTEVLSFFFLFRLSKEIVSHYWNCLAKDSSLIWEKPKKPTSPKMLWWIMWPGSQNSSSTSLVRFHFTSFSFYISFCPPLGL